VRQNVGMSADTAPVLDARRLAWERRTAQLLAGFGLIFLVVYSLYVLVVEPADWLFAVLVIAGVVSWLAFFVDMAARIALTDRGRRWRFIGTHPLDVLSLAIPLVRVIRVAGLLKHIPLFRGGSGNAVRGSVIAHAAIYAILYVYAIALAALSFERDAPGASITTFGDAVWWALVTITTVGYGDTVPVTGVGRVLAIMLMGGGLVIVGTISAIVVSVITERIAAHQSPESSNDDQPSHSASSAS
jgi:voltage-gated potassium channel